MWGQVAMHLTYSLWKERKFEKQILQFLDEGQTWGDSYTCVWKANNVKSASKICKQKEFYTMTRWGLSQRCIQYMKISDIHHIDKQKRKSHMIISIDAEQTQYQFMTKTLTKLGIGGNFLNLLKNIYGRHMTNIIWLTSYLNGEKLGTFP